MKKNSTAIVTTTLIVCVMFLFFTIMIIFIQNHFDVSSDVVETEKKDLELQLDMTEEEVSTEQETFDLGVIYTSDKIDLSKEDNSSHDVEYESSYSNTLELLPSVFYMHQPVDKKQVDTSNFMESYCGLEQSSISFGTGVGQEDKISVPSEIYLYNVAYESSNSYELKAEIVGDNSYIKSLGWSTPDSSKVKLSKTSGGETIVSRASDYTGTVIISLVVSYDRGNGITATEQLEVYVHVLDMTDKSTQLYDKNGNQLYLDKDGKEIAHLSDYAKRDVFYGTMKVNGWQVIDGKTYYFNENSWAVRGEQIIGGTKYEFDEEGVLIAGEEVKGIDVSLYQKEIDWKKVAASGIDFAIIRCGFRGSASGRMVEDSFFRRNIEGAIAEGIDVGVYFFTQAINEKEAIEEADMVLALCKEYELDYPMFIDTEKGPNGRANGLDKETRTRVIKAFCERITEAGHRAGVYASTSWYRNQLNAKELEQYCIWVAQYNVECTYKGKADYWQYTSKGQIAGIEGYVDMDIILRP